MKWRSNIFQPSRQAPWEAWFQRFEGCYFFHNNDCGKLIFIPAYQASLLVCYPNDVLLSPCKICRSRFGFGLSSWRLWHLENMHSSRLTNFKMFMIYPLVIAYSHIAMEITIGHHRSSLPVFDSICHFPGRCPGHRRLLSNWIIEIAPNWIPSTSFFEKLRRNTKTLWPHRPHYLTTWSYLKHPSITRLYFCLSNP